MQIWAVFQKTVIVIDMMFHTDAKVFKKSYRDAWLEYSYQTISRQSIVRMYKIIKTGKAQRGPLIQVKCFFQLCLQPTTKIILPHFRCIGAKLCIVSCKGYNAY